jgi:hypothetical protein
MVRVDKFYIERIKTDKGGFTFVGFDQNNRFRPFLRIYPGASDNNHLYIEVIGTDERSKWVSLRKHDLSIFMDVLYQKHVRKPVIFCDSGYTYQFKTIEGCNLKMDLDLSVFSLIVSNNSNPEHQVEVSMDLNQIMADDTMFYYFNEFVTELVRDLPFLHITLDKDVGIRLSYQD